MHGLEMVELARLAGVSRATISQIEEGRTKKPNKKVVNVLSRMSGDSPETLAEKVEAWINRLTVSKYERDQFVGGMPDTLAHALVSRLGITEEYLFALEGLPACQTKTN